MVLFTSSIGAALYDVQSVSYSYPHDDTDTMTFVPCTDGYFDNASLI